MTKKIDFTKTVYELVNEYPEIVDIMEKLGFSDITKKSKLNSLGKIITIPKGAKIKDISMLDIVNEFSKNGFEIVGNMVDTNIDESKNEEILAERDFNSRKELLKSYLIRLGQGEDLEKVRKEFVDNFSHVEASEIMEAEEELIKEGTPINEIQRLCDLHSALFHGKTTEEKIANAEKAVMETINKNKEKEIEKVNKIDKHKITRSLEKIKGHPLNTFSRENKALKFLIDKYRLEKKDDIITKIRELSIHYAKKGDLIYPHLKVKYDIKGPSDVMWTVDNEIRDEISLLNKEIKRDDKWHSRFDKVLVRVEEMIYKEENILFPICAVNFTEEEWYSLYHDLKDYKMCFGIEEEIWEEGESRNRDIEEISNDEIILPGGHMSISELRALLNTIPLEITFVDKNNINRFFNEGPKLFKRPKMAIDRDVFSCHPPKVEPMVREIINDFRNGVRDTVPVWMEKEGRTMLVTYMAVRDHNNTYIGTMEIVQDMEFAKEYFKNK